MQSFISIKNLLSYIVRRANFHVLRKTRLKFSIKKSV